MTYFNYKRNQLYCEKVSLKKLCDTVQTPFYVYSSNRIIDNYKVLSNSLRKTDCLIAFAVKANSNISILRTLAKCGAGADVVSYGELKKAMVAGINPNKIVFSGVGKKPSEIKEAIDAKILQFNIESFDELETVASIAKDKNMQANIALRVNPDVKAGGHPKISTGKKTDKFGIAMSKSIKAYNFAKDNPYLNVIGVDLHIGSQILNINPFKKAFNRLIKFTLELERAGHNIKNVDLGGGIGINYQSKPNNKLIRQYLDLIKNTYSKLNKKIIIEPGRFLVADSGILVTKVIYKKSNENKNFVIIDAGMNDFMRPALYSAKHQIKALIQGKEKLKENTYDVVGPICETSDTMAESISLSREIKKGDYLYIDKVGAYGSVMSSNYNTRETIQEILVKDKDYETIKNKIKVEQLISQEKMASWLK